jgi:hypothetical protein
MAELAAPVATAACQSGCVMVLTRRPFTFESNMEPSIMFLRHSSTGLGEHNG